MWIVSRSEAVSVGKTRYFTGKPCKYGHISERMVSNKGCVVCLREATKQWSLGDTRSAARQQQWKEQNREQYREAKRRYYAIHKDRQKTASDIWRKKNPDKIKEQSRRSRERHPDRLNARVKRWKGGHPERVLSYGHKRRSLARSGSFSDDEINTIYRLQKGKCAYCRKRLRKSFERDHIVPLSRGGINEARNIQLVCRRSCNQKKSNKDPMEFAREIGLLL